jgi:hypothetical protein
MTLLNESGSSRGLGSLALERQLAELRARLERAAVANPELPVGTVTRSGGTPTRVSGLTPTLAPGQVVWSWNASNTADLRYYELQVSSDEGFEQDVTTYVTGLRTQATPLTAGTTYYARVRVVNQAGNPGGWSSVEDSLPGTVSTAELAENSASAIYEFEQASGFSTFSSGVAAGLWTGEETYGPLTITVTTPSAVVIPRLTFDVDALLVYSGGFFPGTDTNPTIIMRVELLRRESGGADEIIDDAEYDIMSTLRVNEVELPSFASFDEPGVGVWEYRYRLYLERFTTDGTTTVDVTPLYLKMEFIQHKR